MYRALLLLYYRTVSLFKLHSITHNFYVLQDDVNHMLLYSLKVCMSLIGNRQFKKTVLQVLSKLYMELDIPDYINVCQVNTTAFTYYNLVFPQTII